MDKEVEFAITDLSVPSTMLHVGEFVLARPEPMPEGVRTESYDYTVYTPGNPRVIIGRPPRDAQEKMTRIEKEWGDRGFKGEITAIHQPHEGVADAQVRIHLNHDS
jgi:hypothetical protein